MRKYSAPRPITADDVVADFDSGEPSLDDWLRRRALANRASGASRCFVTSRGGRVVGHYALATGIVQRADASRRIARNMPEPIPVILLGRLAVDREEQGHRLGAHLLRDAIAPDRASSRDHWCFERCWSMPSTNAPVTFTSITTSSPHPPTRCICC